VLSLHSCSYVSQTLLWTSHDVQFLGINYTRVQILLHPRIAPSDSAGARCFMWCSAWGLHQ
jgi:hypothetical protein